jgi:hypothetical protein
MMEIETLPVINFSFRSQHFVNSKTSSRFSLPHFVNNQTRSDLVSITWKITKHDLIWFPSLGK